MSIAMGALITIRRRVGVHLILRTFVFFLYMLGRITVRARGRRQKTTLEILS